MSTTPVMSPKPRAIKWDRVALYALLLLLAFMFLMPI